MKEENQVKEENPENQETKSGWDPITKEYRIETLILNAVSAFFLLSAAGVIIAIIALPILVLLKGR